MPVCKWLIKTRELSENNHDLSKNSQFFHIIEYQVGQVLGKRSDSGLYFASFFLRIKFNSVLIKNKGAFCSNKVHNHVALFV